MVTSRGSQGSPEDWPRRPRLFYFFGYISIFELFQQLARKAEVCFYNLNLKGAKTVMDCLHGLMIISSLS